MNIEDRLRNALRRRAAAVQARPDLDDVGARTASRERRTRHLLTAGLVVALIAGPLAGFAIGNGRGDGGGAVAVGTGTTGPESARSARDSALSAAALGGVSPMEKLFVRTSADGIAIRAYLSTATTPAVPQMAACVAGADCPAPECVGPASPRPRVMGELSTEAAVTIASGVVGQTSGSAVSGATWGTFGVGEGSPARWVMATVSENVKQVRARIPGGTTDEMEPVHGAVLLASQVGDPDAAGATLEALDGAGTVVQTVDLTPGTGGLATASSGSAPSSGSAESSVELRSSSSTSGSDGSANARSSASSSASSSVSSSPGVAASCVAPVPSPPAGRPTLPPAGGQPADPIAARTAVEQAFTMSGDGTRPEPERLSMIEDGPALEASYKVIWHGPNAQQVKDATSTAREVVFTSPTRAAVIYDIAVKNWPSQFPGRVGQAVLIDGIWKVARETACADLSLGGVTCPSK